MKLLHSFQIRLYSLVTLILISASLQAQNVETAVDSSRVVRVLSFNILHGATMKGDFDLDLIASVIKSVNPDLVAMQEVDFKTGRAKRMDLVTELAFRTGMSPLFGKAMAYDGGEYGEGILAKSSFVSTRNHALMAREGKEPRSAVEANIILKSGDTIRFIGTHLDHTKDAIDRINQANQINQIFANCDSPSILAGDLNATPDSKTMDIFYQKWEKSFVNDEPTYPSEKPRVKIDHILYRPAKRWRVLETKVLDEKVASDHCPVLSVLELLPE